MNNIILFFIVTGLTGCCASRPEMKKNSQIRVVLPGRKAVQVEVVVRKSGLYYKGIRIKISSLLNLLKNAVAVKKADTLLIRSDRVVVYGRLVTIMDIARMAGIERIQLAVRK